MEIEKETSDSQQGTVSECSKQNEDCSSNKSDEQIQDENSNIETIKSVKLDDCTDDIRKEEETFKNNMIDSQKTTDSTAQDDNNVESELNDSDLSEEGSETSEDILTNKSDTVKPVKEIIATDLQNIKGLEDNFLIEQQENSKNNDSQSDLSNTDTLVQINQPNTKTTIDENQVNIEKKIVTPPIEQSFENSVEESKLESTSSSSLPSQEIPLVSVREQKLDYIEPQVKTDNLIENEKDNLGNTLREIISDIDRVIEQEDVQQQQLLKQKIILQQEQQVKEIQRLIEEKQNLMKQIELQHVEEPKLQSMIQKEQSTMKTESVIAKESRPENEYTGKKESYEVNERDDIGMAQSSKTNTRESQHPMVQKEQRSMSLPSWENNPIKKTTSIISTGIDSSTEWESNKIFPSNRAQLFTNKCWNEEKLVVDENKAVIIPPVCALDNGKFKNVSPGGVYPRKSGVRTDRFQLSGQDNIQENYDYPCLKTVKLPWRETLETSQIKSSFIKDPTTYFENNSPSVPASQRDLAYKPNIPQGWNAPAVVLPKELYVPKEIPIESYAPPPAFFNKSTCNEIQISNNSPASCEDQLYSGFLSTKPTICNQSLWIHPHRREKKQYWNPTLYQQQQTLSNTSPMNFNPSPLPIRKLAKFEQHHLSENQSLERVQYHPLDVSVSQNKLGKNSPTRLTSADQPTRITSYWPRSQEFATQKHEHTQRSIGKKSLFNCTDPFNKLSHCQNFNVSARGWNSARNNEPYLPIAFGPKVIGAIDYSDL